MVRDPAAGVIKDNPIADDFRSAQGLDFGILIPSELLKPSPNFSLVLIEPTSDEALGHDGKQTKIKQTKRPVALKERNKHYEIIRHQTHRACCKPDAHYG
jgi:hypothetical protein